MWRRRKSEGGGYQAVSATTKWVQFKLQNINQFIFSLPLLIVLMEADDTLIHIGGSFLS